MSAPKSIQILVMGGCHTYGFGVPFGNGFIQRMIFDWERQGIQVKADYYAPAKCRKVADLLTEYPDLPSDYDLILLQLGHFELMARSFFSLFRSNTDYNNSMYGKWSEVLDKQWTPSDIRKLHTAVSNDEEWMKKKSPVELKYNFRSSLKSLLIRIYAWVRQPAYLQRLQRQLLQISTSLEKHHARVLFIEPFPTADPLTNWLRKWGNKQIRREAEEHGFGVLGVYDLLNRNPDCLLSDGAHLNDVGHYLVWVRLQKWLRIHRFDLGKASKSNFNFRLHTN